MVKFNSKIQKINDGANYFYQTLPELLEELTNIPENKYFTYSLDTNIQVANKIKKRLIEDEIIIAQFSMKSQLVVNVVGYKPFNPWSKVVGYTTKKSNTIYVNLRKIPSMSDGEIAGHLFHEVLHILGYGHGNNFYSDKKKYSINYFLGYLLSGEVNIEDLQDHPYL